MGGLYTLHSFFNLIKLSRKSTAYFPMYYLWCQSQWALKWQNDKDHLRTQDNNTVNKRLIAVQWMTDIRDYLRERQIQCNGNSTKCRLEGFRTRFIMDSYDLVICSVCRVCYCRLGSFVWLCIDRGAWLSARVCGVGWPSFCRHPACHWPFSLELHFLTTTQHAPWTCVCMFVCKCVYERDGDK